MKTSYILNNSNKKHSDDISESCSLSLYFSCGQFQLPIGIIKAQDTIREWIGRLCLFTYNRRRNGLAYFALDLASAG
jgi:hypothetical protein